MPVIFHIALHNVDAFLCPANNIRGALEGFTVLQTLLFQRVEGYFFAFFQPLDDVINANQLAL
jgi:hypothetical protein